MLTTPRPAARLLIAVAGCFLLGAATAACSVLFLAALPPLGRIRSSSSRACVVWEATGRPAEFMIEAHSGPAYLGYSIRHPIDDIHGDFVLRAWDVPPETFLPPEALLAARESWHSVPPYRTRLIEYHGWPLPAAYSVSDLAPAFNPLVSASGPTALVVSATTGHRLPGLAHARPSFTLPFDAVLPLQPLGSGIAINTSVFTCTYGMLLGAASAARRAHRRRRGRCPSCGYSRVGLAATAPCPECGAAGRPPEGA